ncbi:MAG: PKD domain-containing protein [Candidatus Freyarchaeota archaeon]
MVALAIISTAAHETTTLYINPPHIADLTKTPGTTLTIDVNVADVSELYAWSFQLKWDPDILSVTDVTEGQLLSQNGHSTYFVSKVDPDLGYMAVWCTLKGEPATAAASGSGTLATITFKVEGEGFCSLDLYDTKLLDCHGNEIKHMVNDGYFVNVEAEVRTPVASFTLYPKVPCVGEMVIFNASDSYDPDGTIVRYMWSFGDGAFGEGVTAEHTYLQEGAYTVVLTISDDDGLTDTVAVDITVFKASHDIAIVGITTSPSGWAPVPQGDPVYINVTVENRGDFYETFDVSVYADRNMGIVGDEIVVGKQRVYNLPPGASWVLELIWDTTGVPYGTYRFSAEADTVPNELNVDNNVLVSGAFVGGICTPRLKQEVDLLALLAPVLSSVVVLVLQGAAAVILLRVLTSARLRWPVHLIESLKT